MKRFALLLSFVALAACEGATGPTGPAGPMGPAGPQGSPGVGTRVQFTGTIPSSGDVLVTLPAAAGSAADLPVYACYVSDDGDPWLLIADGDFTTSGPFCAIGTRSSTGTLGVALTGVPPGWLYAIVVVY